LKDAGRLYDRTHELRNQGTVIDVVPSSNERSGNSIFSASLKALMNTFGSCSDGELDTAGVVYVLYEKEATEKVTLGVLSCNNFISFPMRR
jgi:hypothetical protein